MALITIPAVQAATIKDDRHILLLTLVPHHITDIAVIQGVAIQVAVHHPQPILLHQEAPAVLIPVAAVAADHTQAVVVAAAATMLLCRSSR